jgi:hypothetical protein
MKFTKLIAEAFNAGNLIALDLDDTLISNVMQTRASKMLAQESIIVDPQNIDDVVDGMNKICMRYIGAEPLVMQMTSYAMISFPRPHLHEFIAECKSMAKVVILTSADRVWASANVAKFDMGIDEIMTREDMRNMRYECPKCKEAIFDDIYDQCPKCGSEFDITPGIVLVDDSIRHPTKEKFLKIYGGANRLGEMIANIKPYRYGSMAEYGADRELKNIMPVIRSKLKLQATSEGLFAARLSRVLGSE